jgi:hypothetical protein
MIIRRHAIPVPGPIRKTPLVIGDRIYSWEPGRYIRSRTIDDGGRTATAGMVGATGWRVRHYTVSMRDVFAGERSAFVLRAACVGEFAGLSVAHKGDAGGLVEVWMEIFHFSRIFETGGSEIYYLICGIADRSHCEFLSPCFTILSAPTLTDSGAIANHQRVDVIHTMGEFVGIKIISHGNNQSCSSDGLISKL